MRAADRMDWTERRALLDRAAELGLLPRLVMTFRPSRDEDTATTFARARTEWRVLAQAVALAERGEPIPELRPPRAR